MRNLLKEASATLFILSLLGVQGCQPAPQSQSKSANVQTPGNTVNNSASQQPGAPQTQLKVGDMAPDFTLTDTNGQPVKLSDFRGKKSVTLAFYVLAFTGG